MTNTPGWASPGSSDSSEPEDGDSPASSAPQKDTPVDTSTDTSAAGPDNSSGDDSGDATAPGTGDRPATADAGDTTPPPPGGWSAQQPPAGQWQHTPHDTRPPTVPAPGPPPAGSSGTGTGTGTGQAPGAGWARWSPPQPPEGGQPGPSGPRWGNTAPGGGPGGGWQQQGPWSRPAAPKPGVIPLRPLGAGEILDGSLAVLRRHWRAILGFTLAIAVVTQGLAVVVDGFFLSNDTRLENLRDNPNPSVGDIMHAVSGAFASSGLTILVMLIGTITATAMVAMATSRAVLGRPVTAAQVWREARPRLPQLLGLALLIPLAIAGILAGAVLPGALIALAGAESGGAALASLGLIGASVVVLWLMIQWSLAAPALMLEKQDIVSAMKRSAKLVRNSWWRVLGVQALAAILCYIASAIIQTPFMFIARGITGESLGSFLSGDTNPGWAFLGISGIGAAIAATLSLPISAGVTTLLYMDQRIRREALDIELLRAANTDADANAAASVAVTTD
ncbi:hypothetical protein ACFZAM_36150 [Streptomyces sp. NPDC008079]|uniref:hypothetical protein n=1 Tax=Streptomyces sp. NPDC008079 TaxID=3364806 RepID=UPI0036E372E4